MTAFYIAAALMVLLAVVWIALPLVRGGRAPQPRRDRANLAILRDQLAELDSDLRAGTLSEEQYEQAKLDLERRVLEETAHQDDTPNVRATPTSGRLAAVAVALLVSVGAVLLYAQIGSPDALAPQAEQGHQFSPQEIDQMVAQLAERMRANPDDPRGWAILGRTYYVMQRYQESADAYAELIKRIPPDPDVLTDYADALAMAQGRKLTGKPMEALQQALALDPDHWKGLALAGTEAFEREDYRAALRYWERLLAQAPPGSEVGQQVAASVAEARKLAGLPPQTDAPATPDTSAPSAAGVSGTVRLAPEIAAKADPTDTVFVYARPVDGPKMPLAIVRMQVKDLPAHFTLDDTQAMTPAARLSQHERVELVARISKSGNASVQSGDLVAGARDVAVGSADLSLVIDTQVP
ncbi:MAG TPA: c-type cytochrome biogenesis protein CcmI [Burkholderiales bacterium]|nr:c-type cytochrome biogenesis protein CcmI [Burkholderiales bacterium]